MLGRYNLALERAKPNRRKTRILGSLDLRLRHWGFGETERRRRSLRGPISNRSLTPEEVEIYQQSLLFRSHSDIQYIVNLPMR